MQPLWWMDADLEEEGMEFVREPWFWNRWTFTVMNQRTNERNPRGKYTVSCTFIYRNNPFICVLNVFHYGANMSFICAYGRSSIQNYQKVNNIANCAIKSLLLKKACPKTIVVSWQQILFRQKLKYVHLQPMNVYGKNSTVKGVNINVDRLYNSAWCCPSNGYSI